MSYYDFKKGNADPHVFYRREIDNNAKITGIYIDENDGSEQEQSTWSATDFLEIEGNAIFFTGTFLQYSSNIYNAFYDADKNYISRYTLPTNPDNGVTIPANAKYVRFSCRTNLYQSNHYFFGYS